MNPMMPMYWVRFTSMPRFLRVFENNLLVQAAPIDGSSHDNSKFKMGNFYASSFSELALPL
jgi:hypothetical protein